MCKSVPNSDCANELLCAFLRSRFLPFGLPCCALGFLFCRLLLPELAQLALKFVLKFPRAAHICTRREFDTALLQRVHGSGAYLFVYPNIGAKAATCALKLLFTFTF